MWELLFVHQFSALGQGYRTEKHCFSESPSPAVGPGSPGPAAPPLRGGQVPGALGTLPTTCMGGTLRLPGTGGRDVVQGLPMSRDPSMGGAEVRSYLAVCFLGKMEAIGRGPHPSTCTHRCLLPKNISPPQGRAKHPDPGPQRQKCP